jgi:hypothetical protein
MKFKNTLHTEIYDKDNNLLRKYSDKNLVVSQGKEIIRDCLIYSNKMLSNCISYWKLNDNDVTTVVKDEIGSFDGTCSVNTDTIYNSNGKLDDCQHKTSTVYTEVGGDSDFQYQEFSISLWVKFDSVSDSPTMFGGQTSVSWNNGFAMRLVSGKLYFYTNHYMSGEVLQSTTTPVIDKWYHCVFVVNDSGTNRMYIDGVQEGAVAYQTITHVNQKKVIGNSTDKNSAYGLNGYIDEVLFFDKALPASEISALYSLNYNDLGLRNIKLSTNNTAPTLSDTTLGTGTEYECGRQTDFSDKNLETDAYFSTTTLEHDTLTFPFRYDNSTGSPLTVNKIGLFDYGRGTERLFSALLLNGGSGDIIPAGGYMNNYYELVLDKGIQTNGYLTDWGIKAIMHGLLYGSADYNLSYVGFGGAIFPSDYEGYYKCEDDTNNRVVTDESTNNRNFESTIDTNLISAVGKDGKGFHYTGREYASRVNFLGTTRTIILRVNPQDISTTSFFSIGNTSEDGFSQIILYTNNDSTYGYHHTAGNTFGTYTIGNWDLIVITQTPTHTDVWLNGTKVINKDEDTTNGTNDNIYLGIGLHISGSEILDDIVFYNRILTDVEITNMGDISSINGLFATTQATLIQASESNKILTSFDYTNSGGVQQVEEIGIGTSNIDSGELFTKFTHSKTLTHLEQYQNTITNVVDFD